MQQTLQYCRYQSEKQYDMVLLIVQAPGKESKQRFLEFWNRLNLQQNIIYFLENSPWHVTGFCYRERTFNQWAPRYFVYGIACYDLSQTHTAIESDEPSSIPS